MANKSRACQTLQKYFQLKPGEPDLGDKPGHDKKYKPAMTAAKKKAADAAFFNLISLRC